MASDGRHERLIVEDQRVRLPGSTPVRLVDGEPALELGRAVDLAGDEQRSVEQERRLLLLDDVEAGPLEGALARRRQLHRLVARERKPSPGPELRMDEHGHARAADRLREAVHAGHVVPVAVAEHDDVDLARGDLEAAACSRTRPSGVRPASNRRRVVRSPFVTVTSAENPCSARGASSVSPATVKRAGMRGDFAIDGRFAGPLISEQRVRDVVHQSGDRQRVDRLERDRFHPLEESLPGHRADRNVRRCVALASGR